jgi:hypothetical protein
MAGLSGEVTVPRDAYDYFGKIIEKGIQVDIATLMYVTSCNTHVNIPVIGL